MTENITNSNMDDSPYRVMLVDDSSVIRSILKQLLGGEPCVQIIGEAENGLLAIDKASALLPDIILLDIEMPEMDGITALPHILKASPASQIIMVSTLTDRNAEISMRAMSRGAADYLQKPEASIDKEVFKADLVNKIKALGFASRDKRFQKLLSQSTVIAPKDIGTAPSAPAYLPKEAEIVKKFSAASFKPLAIAIASSTGGPQALQTLFQGLKNNLPNLPIFITQHMPPVFTKFLATSLSTVSGLPCHEAIDGMEALAGNIYIAPGDFHMLALRDGAKVIIKLNQEPPENYCRPSADPMLRSLLEIYNNQILVVVLTGMGQDGMLGAKMISEKGGMVIAQDKETSVVWGMPGAVCSAGISNGIYPIDEIPGRIIQICAGKGVNNAPK